MYNKMAKDLQYWKLIFLWLLIETLIQEKQEGYNKALNG